MHSFIICCVLCLALTGVLVEGTTKPFRVFWNYWDVKCIKRDVIFNLDAYGIEHNQGSFVGDTVALYYGDVGKWPYYNHNNQSDPINGGLPQMADLQGHLLSIAKAINDSTSPGAKGIGVFDQELWVPILKKNWGFSRVYVDQSKAIVAEKFPHLSKEDQLQIAEDSFAMASKFILSSTLALARALRPNMSWGYYGYPRLWARNHNDELSWLWQATTGFYPSIYIKRKSDPIDKLKTYITEVIKESFRARAGHGIGRDPIFVYTDAQFKGMGFFTKDYLDLSIRMPIEMGVDGLVLWASSNFYHDDPKAKCLELQHYLDTTLGPYLQNLTATMTKCSTDLCKGQGRCLKKVYAEAMPYSVSKTMDTGELSDQGNQEKEDDVTDEASTTDEKWEEFVCQCYQGWEGDKCDVQLT